jgi:hypothetical protein
MIAYGNSRTKITGIIRKVQQKQAMIQFPEFQKECPVPCWFIHSPLKEDPNTPQELEIETWYLKKNRIIPLNEAVSNLSRLF